MEQLSKHLLMLSFYFPPDNSSSGMLRPLKFAKYLPEFGWNPAVLTVKETHYENCDSNLLREIPPDVKVWRTRALNARRFLSLYGKHLRLFSIPDPYVGWLPFALIAGLRIIRKEGIQALYSTSPLATTHLIASGLQFFTGLPWVADFRDPWTEPELVKDPGAPLFRFECALERMVLRRANRILFTTERLCEQVLARYPHLPRKKCAVIPNGYDEQDFGRVPGSPPGEGPIRILHAGLVNDTYRSPRSLLEAVAAVLHAGEVPERGLQLEFLGGGEYTESSQFRELVTELGLQKIVRVSGRVGYEESLSRQALSHVLLLLQCGEDTRSLIPAKVFEYLRIGRPILALVLPGATWDLLAEAGGASTADPTDRDQVREALRDVLSMAEGRRPMDRAVPQVLEKYGRRNLTSRLAVLLNELVQPAAGERFVPSENSGV